MTSRTRTFYTTMALAVVASAVLFSLGCADRNAGGDRTTDTPRVEDKLPAITAKEKKIQAARARLVPEDRALVDAQDYCAVMPTQKLGAMGMPIKVLIQGKPVFLCCKSCKTTAEDEPGATLKAAEELQAKAKKK